MSNSKKILFVWDNLAELGGVRTFLISCLHSLPDCGYDVHLLDLHDQPVKLDREARRYRERYTQLERRRWDSERSFELRLYRQLWEYQPDLVVFVEWRHAEDTLRCLPAEVPVINFCLVDRPDDRYYEYARQHVERVKLILGNSYYITRRLRETLDPRYHNKISELFIGVHVPGKWDAEDHTGEPLQLVYMSRLNQDQKRARDLVPFCQGLAEAGVAFRLTVVGDGPERAYIEKELKVLFAKGQVELCGTLPFPEAMARFLQKDIFILFSAYEGMPLVLLHALAAGVLPVVTNVRSGVSELIENKKNGLLFPVGRPEAAVKLVAGLDADRPRLLELRRAARALGEQNSIRVTMVEFEKRLMQIFEHDQARDAWRQACLPKIRGRNWKERLAYRLPLPLLRWMGYGA